MTAKRKGTGLAMPPLVAPSPTAPLRAKLDVIRWRNLILRTAIAELLLEAPHRDIDVGRECLCRWCKARRLLEQEDGGQ